MWDMAIEFSKQLVVWAIQTTEIVAVVGVGYLVLKGAFGIVDYIKTKLTA
jgi:hypothetical protein